MDLYRNMGHCVYEAPLWCILATQAYLWMSVLIFAFGPWPWPVSNPLLLYTTIGLAYSAMFVGYLIGRRSRTCLHSACSIHPQWVVLVGCMISAGLLGGAIATMRVGSSLGQSIVNPGAAYQDTAKAGLSGEITIFEQMQLLVSPLTWVAIPAGVFYWPRLPLATRSLLVITIMLEEAYGLRTGKVQNVAVTLAVVGPVYVLRLLSQRRRIRLTTLALLAGVAFLTLHYFSRNLSSRFGEESYVESYDAMVDMHLNTEDAVFRILPEWGQSMYANFAQYLTEGYYGLSLCLMEDFQWTYGVGHSRILLEYLRDYANVDLLRATYMGRAEATTGYVDGQRWHTILPPLASDVSFPGAIVLMGLFGYFFAVAARHALFGRDMFAVALFGKAWLLVFFTPALNFLAVNRYQYFSTVCIALAWGYSAQMARRA
jgi:hypothetical protein